MLHTCILALVILFEFRKRRWVALKSCVHNSFFVLVVCIHTSFTLAHIYFKRDIGIRITKAQCGETKNTKLTTLAFICNTFRSHHPRIVYLIGLVYKRIPVSASCLSVSVGTNSLNNLVLHWLDTWSFLLVEECRFIPSTGSSDKNGKEHTLQNTLILNSVLANESDIVKCLLIVCDVPVGGLKFPRPVAVCSE